MVTIRELKEHIGQNAENIISQGLGLHRIGGKYRCPNAVAHKNGDKNPSLSWDPKALQFYCFACRDFKIDIYGYHREQGLSHSEIMQEYGLLDQQEDDQSVKDLEIELNFEALKENQIQYLKSRGIEKETASYFQLSNSQLNIFIPYHSGEGRITGAKIKNLKSETPKYFSLKGSVFGLFNKSNLSPSEPLIITEGEFDAMIIHQSGFRNVGSVGTGANSLDKFFQIEKQFLDRFISIIVIADNDEAGKSMEKAFVKKFGLTVKLADKDLFNGLKDVTEIYLKYGASQIQKVIHSASQKIEGLRNLDIEPYKGLEDAGGKYIPTGLSSIDYAINDLGPGILTLITGRSNGGKSTLVNQIIASAIDTGHKTLLIAGEGLQEILINNLYKAVIGREESYYSYKKINKRHFKEPVPAVLRALQQWHRGKFTIFNKGDSKLKSTLELLELMEMEIKTNKPDLVVVDNLMSILSVEKAAEKYEIQGDFCQRLTDLAKAYKIHVILVLHPNKTVTKGSSMDFEQISGSADIYNKSDIILSVKRNYDSEKIREGRDGEVSILKNRYYPDLVTVETNFDIETGLLLELDPATGGALQYRFKWSQHLEKYEKDFFKVKDEFIKIPDNVQMPFEDLM